MSNEDPDKKMEFILNQQAQFVENFQLVEEGIRKLEEAQTRAEGRTTRLEGAIVGLVGMIERLTQTQERTVSNVAELTEKITTLAEAQAHTDQRVNALINAFERFLEERRNGENGRNQTP